MSLSPKNFGGAKSVFIVFTYLLIGIFGTGIIYYEFKDTQKSVQDSILKVRQKEEVLAKIRYKFGYGGFIHHFKNFLLRRSSDYYEKALRDKVEISTLLGRYRGLGNISKIELDRLEILENTLNEYSMKFDIIAKGSKTNVIHLDSLVKVDDVGAMAAFSDIDILLQSEQIKLDIKLANLFSEFARKLIGFNFISFFVILIVSFYLFALIDRSNRRIELSLQKHRVYMGLLELLKSSHLDLYSKLNLALDKVFSYPIFDSEKMGAFFMKNENFLELVASYNLSSVIQEHWQKVDLSQCACGESLENLEILKESDFKISCNIPEKDLLEYTVPVISKSEKLGVFTLLHKNNIEDELAHDGVDRYLEICSSIIANIITESRLQDNLVKEKQISAVKDLIAKVAHEINNPLLIALLTYRKFKKTINSELVDELEVLNNALKRIAAVTHEIQELSSDDKLIPKDNYRYKKSFFKNS